MLLLDTCALLWLVTSQDKLSKSAIKSIVDNKRSLFVSSISVFEIAVKAKKKKLTVKPSVEKWFEQALTLHGLKEIVIGKDILTASVALPNHHADPADRIIIATAQINNMSIVTADKLIKQYKSVDVIW